MKKKKKNTKFRVHQMFWKWVFLISKHGKIRRYNRNKKLFFSTISDFKFTPWNVNNITFFFQNRLKPSDWNFFGTFFLHFLSAPAHAEISALLYMHIFAFFPFITMGWKWLIFYFQDSHFFSCRKKFFFLNFFIQN